MTLEDTNLSVPKANQNPDPPDAKSGSKDGGIPDGVKKAGKAAAVGSTPALGAAGVVGIASKGAKAASEATNFFAQMAGKAVDFLANTAGKAIGAVTNTVSNVVGGIGSFFGGIGSAATSVITTVVTTTAVAVTTVAGVGSASSSNSNPAVYDEPAIQNECSVFGKASADDAISGASSEMSSLEERKNAWIAYNILRTWLSDNGSTNAENQAIGIVVNMRHECGLNPKSIQNGSTYDSTDYDWLMQLEPTGVGLVQWTNYKDKSGVVHYEKCAALGNFCKENNLPWDTVESQCAFFISGKDTMFPSLKTYVEKSNGSYQAWECDQMFLYYFEKCKGYPSNADWHADGTSYYHDRHVEKTAKTDSDTVRLMIEQYEANKTAEDDAAVTSVLAYAADMSSDSDNVVGSISSEMSKLRTLCVSSGSAISGKNDSIAEAAVSFAWESRDKASNNGTKLFQKLVNATVGSPYKSCCRVPATAMAWSGADVNFAHIGGVDNQRNYLDGKTTGRDGKKGTEKWSYVGKVEFGEDGMPTNCQPGDILIISKDERAALGVNYGGHGHVMVYVGHEAIAAKFPNAVESTNTVAASFGSYSACCITFSSSGADSAGYNVYRCTTPDNSDEYKNIAAG